MMKMVVVEESPASFFIKFKFNLWAGTSETGNGKTLLYLPPPTTTGTTNTK